MRTAKALVPALPDMQLKDLISRFDLLLKLKGAIESRAVPAKFWSDFFAAPASIQRNVYDQISNYFSILEEASKHGINLQNDKQLAWYAVKKLQLIPPAGFLDTVDPEDYIEIYNASGIQIFRNLEFYRLVSYSVAEITFYPWDMLYHRDETILKQIVEQGFAKGFVAALHQGNLKTDLAQHMGQRSTALAPAPAIHQGLPRFAESQDMGLNMPRHIGCHQGGADLLCLEGPFLFIQSAHQNPLFIVERRPIEGAG